MIEAFNMMSELQVVTAVSYIAQFLWTRFTSCHYSICILLVLLSVDVLIQVVRLIYATFSTVRRCIIEMIVTMLHGGSHIIGKIVETVGSILSLVNQVKRCIEEVFDFLNILYFRMKTLKEGQKDVEERSKMPLEYIKKNKYFKYDWRAISKRSSIDEILDNPDLPWESEIVTSKMYREKGTDFIYENRDKITIDMDALSDVISLYHVCEYEDWKNTLSWGTLYSRCGTDDFMLKIFDKEDRDSVIKKLSLNHPINVQKKEVEVQRGVKIPDAKIADLGGVDPWAKTSDVSRINPTAPFIRGTNNNMSTNSFSRAPIKTIQNQYQNSQNVSNNSYQTTRSEFPKKTYNIQSYVPKFTKTSPPKDDRSNIVSNFTTKVKTINQVSPPPKYIVEEKIPEYEEPSITQDLNEYYDDIEYTEDEFAAELAAYNASN